MKQHQKKVTYDTRFKHKLNMPEPGSKMLLVAAALAGSGFVPHSHMDIRRTNSVHLRRHTRSGAHPLVAIEVRQDRILNQIAEEENREEEKV